MSLTKTGRPFWSLTKPLVQIAAASMLKREEILVNCQCLAWCAHNAALDAGMLKSAARRRRLLTVRPK